MVELADKFKRVRLIGFDFDGVFTDNRVIVREDGKESVVCMRSDGLGLARLKEVGVEVIVVSTETNPIVEYRCKKLKIRCVSNCNNKLEVMKEEIGRLGIIDTAEVAFLGNDINDVEVLKYVGLPMIVADAYEEIHKYAIYKTQRPGGLGAVREVCDLIFMAKKGII
jgi:YrbI family 3-deoxy-D-manno-octulosonate 8-phosphate phosphatase